MSPFPFVAMGRSTVSAFLKSSSIVREVKLTRRIIAADLAQEVLILVLDKLRAGAVREPE